MGVVIAEEKTEGPATRLTILGIEFDTMAMELRLLDSRLTEALGLWREAKWETPGPRVFSRPTCRR